MTEVRSDTSFVLAFTKPVLYPEKAEQVAANIKVSGGSAISIPGDMLDDAYIKTLVEKSAEFGNGKIHIIVNNAGYTWDGVIHKAWLSRLLSKEALTSTFTDHR